MTSARTAALAVLAVVSLPLWSFGQSTLSFPRVMQPQDYALTGYAIVNPASTDATVTFTLYGRDGTVLSTPTNQTIPAKGQFSKFASQLFPTATAAGWIQATTATTGLQGFWFAGDFLTTGDGAEAATPSTQLVVPLVSPQAEIDIANTGASDLTVLLDLLGTEGFDLAQPMPQKIPAKGFVRADMAALFPNLDDYSLPSHMRINCGCSTGSFVATVISRDFLNASGNLLNVAPSWSASNGVAANATATTIYFPYLVQGPQPGSNWISLLGLTNLSTTSENDVSITFTSDTGAIVRNSQQTLPPNGGLRFLARDLFGLTTGFQTGWVRVTSLDGLPLTGYIAFADTIAAGVSVVPPQQEPQSNLLFTHIADLPPFLTGMAILNANSVAANVEVFAITPNGSLIGSTSFSLGPNNNSAKLLRELVQGTQPPRSTDGGYIFIRSSQPVYAIELFFSRDNRFIANVPIGKVSGTFVPPTQ